MTTMLLFLGGCQREEEIVYDKEQLNRSSAVLDSTMLSKFLFKDNGDFNKGSRTGEDLPAADSLKVICNLILKIDSSHHFLANFLETFGYPDWNHSFYYEVERSPNQVIVIPFLKDGSITGILQYYSKLGENGLYFFSKSHVLQFINLDLKLKSNQFDLLGVLSYIMSQNRNNQTLDDALRSWFIDFSQSRIENEETSGSRVEVCETVCEIQITYIDGGRDHCFYGCVTICSDAVGYITNLPSTGTPVPGISPSGPGGTTPGGEPTKTIDQINQEEEAKRKKALDECVMSQGDAATEGMINNILSDITFPCLDQKSLMLKKAALKQKIKEAWCKDNYDNPGALLPDGTNVKPKITESDVEKALNEALKSEIDAFIACIEPNPCEIELMKKYPLETFYIYFNSMTAVSKTIEKFGFSGWLDCSDAFRHCLFNALNTIDVGEHIALLFGLAHECDETGIPGTGNEVEMDLFNNNKGQTIGSSFPNVSFDVIVDRVCDQLKAGNLKISTGANLIPPDKNAPLANSSGCECN